MLENLIFPVSFLANPSVVKSDFVALKLGCEVREISSPDELAESFAYGGSAYTSLLGKYVGWNFFSAFYNRGGFLYTLGSGLNLRYRVFSAGLSIHGFFDEGGLYEKGARLGFSILRAGALFSRFEDLGFWWDFYHGAGIFHGAFSLLGFRLPFYVSTENEWGAGFLLIGTHGYDVNAVYGGAGIGFGYSSSRGGTFSLVFLKTAGFRNFSDLAKLKRGEQFFFKFSYSLDEIVSVWMGYSFSFDRFLHIRTFSSPVLFIKILDVEERQGTDEREVCVTFKVKNVARPKAHLLIKPLVLEAPGELEFEPEEAEITVKGNDFAVIRFHVRAGKKVPAGKVKLAFRFSELKYDIDFPPKQIEFTLKELPVVSKKAPLPSIKVKKWTFEPICDVDSEIPEGIHECKKWVALIIANSDYADREHISSVKWAYRDAYAFRLYLEKTFGVPSDNIIYQTDLTKARMEALLGSAQNPKGSFYTFVEAKKAETVVFYYSGHGATSSTGQAMLVPVDCPAEAIDTGAVPVEQIMKNLSALPGIKRKWIVLEACFSGVLPPGVAGLSIRPRDPASFMQIGDIYMAAASPDQFANYYQETGHGLFTYFLLKGIGKSVEETGAVDFEFLKNYVVENVVSISLVKFNRVQKPVVLIKKAPPPKPVARKRVRKRRLPRRRKKSWVQFLKEQFDIK